MAPQSITAVFDDTAQAESAVGRLEVAGVPTENILVQVSDAERMVVTANVEDRLVEKAMGILTGEGTIDIASGAAEAEGRNAETEDVE